MAAAMTSGIPTPGSNGHTRRIVAPKAPPQSTEVGVSAALPFMVPFKNAWEALRSDEITVNQLVAMRKTDGQARALYRLITLPIRAALRSATFLPETQVEGGQEEATFIEQMLTLPPSAGGMTTPFSRVIAQLLTAIFDGFAAFEHVYWAPTTGPFKGKWVLKKIAHRPSETVTFLLNDKSEWYGLRQQTMYQGRSIDVTIDAEDACYYAANEEERPFYGQSYFQAAFYHWDKKFKLYVIAHLAAQRAAVGTRVGKLPPSPDVTEKNDFQRGLRELGVAQWMTIPDNYSVESLKEGTDFDFLGYINHHNSQMSKSVLAGFFDKEQGGGDAGKLVDFGTQSDALFLLMLSTIMGEVEEVINNQVIPKFIDWNFGTSRYPKFRFGSLSAEEKAAALDLFKTLAVAGQSLAITPEFVHELEKQVAEEFGLEIDWETVEADQAEQAAEEAAAAAAGASVIPGAPTTTPGVPAPVPPVVDPTLLPAGFALTHTDDEAALTRGKPTSGGPKYVRTPAGAKVYGVPIGTPITRDLAERTAAHGIKGKGFGAQNTPKGGGGGTGHAVYGGGLGAPAQHPGGVAAGGDLHSAAKRIFINPKAPGVQLLQFADGTLAIRDAQGHMSTPRAFGIQAFIKLGWVIQPDKSAGKAAAKATKAASKPPAS
jgi:hypothetical protein